MKKMENYRWIIPSLVALGVILLSGGIFLGVKSYETLEASNSKVNDANQKNLSGKQKFKLDEYCQIWLQDDNEIPVMLGKVNEDLLNKTEDEIKAALKEKYPDKEVSTMNKYQIILKTSDEGTDVSKANKYTLENEDGYISVFKYDKQGKKELVEKTSIQIKSLPKSVQEELKEAIILDSEDDAYSRLEDFGS
ncbi:BofC C-terminal domain-containing protein [Intestinibacter bartlettii]|uniref:BofC C-terminal domain-containing protein n=3 Tax=Intestinibacter bartlettii TaxID=261299 RepID=A0ABS6DZH7_9FIRM|nr:BofC C-terminal domain-containing protein [Intestinibacter bartlettii]MBU5337245.1 BofC C-terminal domain-containing protein [Intestinibacter bartlettii]